VVQVEVLEMVVAVVLEVLEKVKPLHLTVIHRLH
jgi:hypothetical protein